MRQFPTLCFLAVMTLSCVFIAHAQEPTREERIAVRRDLEIAKIDLRNYWLVEYPQQRRHIEAAIELTETQILNLKTQLREFRPFTRFTIGQPFPITIRNLQQCLRDAELRLDDLRDERDFLTRFHSDQFRVRAWQVYDARLRLAALEARVADAEQPAQQN